MIRHLSVSMALSTWRDCFLLSLALPEIHFRMELLTVSSRRRDDAGLAQKHLISERSSKLLAPHRINDLQQLFREGFRNRNSL